MSQHASAEPPHSGNEPPELSERWLHEQTIRFLYRQAPTAMLGALVGAGVLLYALHEVVSPTRLTIWFTALTVVTAVRFAIVKAFQKSSGDECDCVLWERRFLVSFWALGAIWGSSGYFLYPETIAYQAIVFFFIIGIIGGVVAMYSVHLTASVVYALLAITPIMVRFLATADPAHIAMSLGALIYLVIAYSAMKMINRFVIEFFKANLELKREVQTRIAVQRELEEAKERAEEATKLKDKFVGLVSHDLRSPLAAIVSGFTILGGNGDVPAAHRERIVDIGARTAKGMLNLIEQLLNISRLQTGAIQPQPRMIDSGALVADILSHTALLAEEKGISLVNELPKGYRVFADPDLYREVIGNLVANAVKFCGAGDAITIRSAVGARATLVVEDTGPGVDPKFLPDLFRHDVKTSGAGSAGEKGTGLGLPYCADIMKAHGGALSVDARPGGGSRFTVSLPETEKVTLVVDDQPGHRMALRRLFEKAFPGVGLVEAENGKDALEKIADHRPALIITDLMMPEMDGFDLLKTLRKIPDLADTPVIVATSSHESSLPPGETPVAIRNRVFSLGATDFVTKPIDADDLIPRIGRFLG
jgi:signal transduction histidine kinase/CheY-like chemotaxis protein